MRFEVIETISQLLVFENILYSVGVVVSPFIYLIFNVHMGTSPLGAYMRACGSDDRVSRFKFLKLVDVSSIYHGSQCNHSLFPNKRNKVLAVVPGMKTRSGAEVAGACRQEQGFILHQPQRSQLSKVGPCALG